MSGTKKSIGAITVVVAAFGGAVMLGSAASAAVTGLQQIGPQSGQLTTDVGGVKRFSSERDDAERALERRYHSCGTQKRKKRLPGAGVARSRMWDMVSVSGSRTDAVCGAG